MYRGSLVQPLLTFMISITDISNNVRSFSRTSGDLILAYNIKINVTTRLTTALTVECSLLTVMAVRLLVSIVLTFFSKLTSDI